LYPNPANNKVSISCKTNDYELTGIIITDPIGNKMMSLEVPESSNEVEIDTRNLVAGIYYCQLYLGKELKEIKKLIILH
jgi:hypothetical protein